MAWNYVNRIWYLRRWILAKRYSCTTYLVLIMYIRLKFLIQRPKHRFTKWYYSGTCSRQRASIKKIQKWYSELRMIHHFIDIQLMVTFMTSWIMIGCSLFFRGSDYPCGDPCSAVKSYSMLFTRGCFCCSGAFNSGGAHPLVTDKAAQGIALMHWMSILIRNWKACYRLRRTPRRSASATTMERRRIITTFLYNLWERIENYEACSFSMFKSPWHP
jgi:hypothetical protein